MANRIFKTRLLCIHNINIISQKYTKPLSAKIIKNFQIPAESEVKINQRQLIDNAVEFAYFHEDDFIVYLTSSKVSLEEDTLWQFIHNPVDMGKTDAEKVDEYLYGGD
ncbi:MAG: hypothetical protein K8R25_04715 [Methanosarcinales archaeon]|nr:hypothetical protein [Methanosarcinales archaeon]